MGFNKGMTLGHIQYIEETVISAFIEAVKGQSMLKPDCKIRRDFPIVYSPLNGTGRMPVTRVLSECGFSNVHLVTEQEHPDGSFPTCPYPNPEVEETMELGLGYAKKINAELLLATDPDCDRVGIAVRNSQGEYTLLSGNGTGMLLLDYICSRKKAMGTMPHDPIFIKTIVTSDMAERIAESYGVRTINVLTGFKYIPQAASQLTTLVW